MRDGDWWGSALAIAGLAAWGGLVVAYWPFTVDDAFVTLRYAEHVARGLGPTWNEGAPPAEGYTSPLWVAVLAVATALGIDPWRAAKALGVLAMLGAIAIAARLAFVLRADAPRRERHLASCAVVFVLGASPATAIHAVSGMETALATCLVAGYALASVRVIGSATRARCGAMALLGLLASLTRPEANLLVAVTSAFALTRLDRDGRARLAGAIGALHVLPGALYFGWRWSYYGHLLPLPFYVKTVMVEGALPGADEALAFLRAGFVTRIDLGIALALGALAARNALAPALTGAIALWAFFFVPAHEMGYDFRYFEPIAPILAAAVAIGLVAARSMLGRAGAAVPALVIAATFGSVVPYLAASIAEKQAYGRGIERAHRAIGLALGAIRDRTDHPVIAVLDAGAIAYHSRWTVIDTWGLNEPVIAIRGTRDAEYVLAQRPEIVIVVSARRDRFVPHFAYERALWNEGRARGLAHVASFEFLPDYHLFVLAVPGSAAARALEPRRAHSGSSAISSRSRSFAIDEPPVGRPSRLERSTRESSMRAEKSSR